MEEYQARKQPPQNYQISYNLAHQPYSMSEQDDEPLEDEMNVLPMPAKPRAIQAASASTDPIVGEPLSPRSQSKRKSSGKGRSPANKAKTAKAYRSPQAAKQQPFADELQHLEDLAERINHILAERARKKAQFDSMPPQTTRGMEFEPRSPVVAPNYEQPMLDQEPTENLKLWAKRIRHRLSQLEVLMDEEEQNPPYPTGVYPPQISHTGADYRQPLPPPTAPPLVPPPVAPSTPQSQSPYPAPANSFDPMRQRAEYEAWRAQAELRQLQAQEQWAAPPAERRDRTPAGYSSFQPLVQQALSKLRRFPVGQLLQRPRKPMDALTDAVMWVAVAAIARIAIRYAIMPFPLLSPIVTLMMLAPAGLALFLAVFVPKTGWMPFYRLFLIMLGLFVGGKFF
ncbi:MAG: hypothetical protein NW220_21465 [Leptolyngbyaceae cyanobacterium bins.349]|nr:hypothetical protein [Leptolyngbyaceae cyanobacterium bins.349]